MSVVRHVTLCLLITYHWHASTGTRNVSVPPTATGVRIAAEVNGSPTDARLNIPVVKRSSNQAGFANELRPSLVTPALSVRPHEYANRNEEKYTRVVWYPMGNPFDGVPPFDTEKSNRVGKKRDGNEPKMVAQREERLGPGTRIKSSILGTMAMDSGLIGKSNSSPVAGESRRHFDYDGKSSPSYRHKRSEDSLGGVEEETSERTKATGADESNNKESIVSSFGGSDPTDVRLGRKSYRNREKLHRGEVTEPVVSGLGGIDGAAEKAEAKEARKKGKEDHRASGSSDRLSTSLKLMERQGSKGSRPSNPVGTTVTVVENNETLNHKRLHQQSRNTRPKTIAQHIRRDTKRQTLSFDDLMYGRSSGYYEEVDTKEDDRERRSSAAPQLRFIPSVNHRPREFQEKIYVGNARRTLGRGSSLENDNEASFFYPNGEPNPRAIVKLPRFDARQLDSLKGVFDKYDFGWAGKANELPNVRTIRPKQVFVAPPKLVYDTKILPAPFSFPPYYPSSSAIFDVSNGNLDNGNGEKIVKPQFEISGVFDQKHHDELDNREAIPVSENPETSLTDTLNFVTPLPPYRDAEGGNGKVSIRVNQPAEDLTELDEIYRSRVGGYIEIGGKETATGERKRQRVEGDEDSRVNQESPIDAGRVVHHPGFAGSSYDNSVSTFGSPHESGSGNVDHSAVIGGIADEYVNPETPRWESYTHAARTRTQSAAKSNDETYDRGDYKWHGKYDNYNERYAANYSFGYRVTDYESQNNFGHRETRKEGVTMGKYHVKLPDGRIQEVDYHVDGKGYHARVSYRPDNAE